MANCNSCGRYVYAADAYPAGTVRCEIDDVCPAYVKPFPRRWADDPEELAAAQRQLENERFKDLGVHPSETKPETKSSAPETKLAGGETKSETKPPKSETKSSSETKPETKLAAETKVGRPRLYPDNAARLRAWRLRRRGG